MTIKRHAMFEVQCQSLHDFLQISSAQLRSGEDAKGIDALLSAEFELEKLVENDQNSQQPLIDMCSLLPVVRTLRLYIKNKDIAGITDLLEDELCPIIEQWMKGGHVI